jgi:hypothetical protein
LQNDVFEGGGSDKDKDEVNLGVNGGSDTLVWDVTEDQMVIFDFFANGDNVQNDVLDFSNLSLNNTNNTNGLTYQGLVTDPGVADVPVKLTADIVGLTDLFATSAKSVETLFKSSGNFLNNLVDKDESIDSKTSMVFLIANSADADADINVWLWNDDSDDGNVQETELTRLGTIEEIGAEDLTTENFSDNVEGEEQGFAPMGMFGGYIAEDIPPVNPTDTVHIMG